MPVCAWLKHAGIFIMRGDMGRLNMRTHFNYEVLRSQNSSERSNINSSPCKRCCGSTFAKPCASKHVGAMLESVVNGSGGLENPRKIMTADSITLIYLKKYIWRSWFKLIEHRPVCDAHSVLVTGNTCVSILDEFMRIVHLKVKGANDHSQKNPCNALVSTQYGDKDIPKVYGSDYV